MNQERVTDYKIAVIQSDEMEIRVTVELRKVEHGTMWKFERTGNWFSCVTDLHKGHILGGSTSGSGNISDSPLEIAKTVLWDRLQRGKIQ